MATWVTDMDLDALWRHRHWQLDMTHLLTDVGVLSYHLPFDETLTIGYNTRLCNQLEALGTPVLLGYKQDMTGEKERVPQWPIGMLVDVPEQEFDYWLHRVKILFGCYDRCTHSGGLGAWGTFVPYRFVSQTGPAGRR